jgi:hypothetical protein
MTRQEILDSYKVNRDGIIKSPGKFEGEMLYAPYFYDHGQGDETWNSEEVEDAFAEVFQVSDDDRKEFPELGNTYMIAVEENEQGFVYLTEFENEEDARKAQLEYEGGD